MIVIIPCSKQEVTTDRVQVKQRKESMFFLYPYHVTTTEQYKFRVRSNYSRNFIRRLQRIDKYMQHKHIFLNKISNNYSKDMRIAI